MSIRWAQLVDEIPSLLSSEPTQLFLSLSHTQLSLTDNLQIIFLLIIWAHENVNARKSKTRKSETIGTKKFACREGNQRQWQCVLREADVNAPRRANEEKEEEEKIGRVYLSIPSLQPVESPDLQRSIASPCCRTSLVRAVAASKTTMEKTEKPPRRDYSCERTQRNWPAVCTPVEDCLLVVCEYITYGSQSIGVCIRTEQTPSSIVRPFFIPHAQCRNTLPSPTIPNDHLWAMRWDAPTERKFSSRVCVGDGCGRANGHARGLSFCIAPSLTLTANSSAHKNKQNLNNKLHLKIWTCTEWTVI